MSRLERLRARLSFANVVSSLALFVALGGSAYAAGALPLNSVGRAQLQANSVTATKLAADSVGRSELRGGAVGAAELAPASIGLRALEPALRGTLARAAETGAPGPQGSAGAQGAAGPQGPSGPGAVRIHFLQHASATPEKQSVFEIAGIGLKADCRAGEPGVQMDIELSSEAAATFVENIASDGGSGSPGAAPASSMNLQVSLPAGVTPLGGPTVGPGEYTRIIAHLIYVAAETTVEVSAVLALDGSTGECSIDGVGIPAS